MKANGKNDPSIHSQRIYGLSTKTKKPKRKRMENIQFQDTQTEPWMRRKQKNRT